MSVLTVLTQFIRLKNQNNKLLKNKSCSTIFTPGTCREIYPGGAYPY